MASIDWTPVEEATAEQTLAGYKVALLESLKILETRLREERIPGQNLAERLAAAGPHFTRSRDVERAVSYTEGLRAGQTGALTTERAKNYLQSFRQAVADLNDLSQVRNSLAAKLRLYFGLVRGRQRWLVRGLVGIALFAVLVLVLADTAPGQAVVGGTVAVVHFFFRWVLAVVVGALVLLGVVFATAVFLDRDRGGRIKTEPDD